MRTLFTKVEQLFVDIAKTSDTIQSLEDELSLMLMDPLKVVPFLNAGRMVFLEDTVLQESDQADPSSSIPKKQEVVRRTWGWGLVVKFEKKILGGKGKGKKGKGKGKGVSESEEAENLFTDWELKVLVGRSFSEKEKLANAGKKKQLKKLEDLTLKTVDSGVGVSLEKAQPGCDIGEIYTFDLKSVKRVSKIRAQVTAAQCEGKKDRFFDSLMGMVRELGKKQNDGKDDDVDNLLSHSAASGAVPLLSSKDELKLDDEIVERETEIRAELKERKGKREENKFKVLERHLNGSAVVRDILWKKFLEKRDVMDRVEYLKGLLEKEHSMLEKAAAVVEVAEAAGEGGEGEVKKDEDEKKEDEKKKEDDSFASISTELCGMKTLLKSLNFIKETTSLTAEKKNLLKQSDRSYQIQLKGRLACELSSGDEILLTELIFRNFFSQDLQAEHMVALLSCLVFDERKSEENKQSNNCSKHPILVKSFVKLKEIAREVGDCMEKAGVLKGDGAEKYVERLNPEMMDVTMSWLCGESFCEIMGSCALYEGTIVRVLRRLEELIRELQSAVKGTLGDGYKELEGKLSEGRLKLKRGIIFAASLYL